MPDLASAQASSRLSQPGPRLATMRRWFLIWEHPLFAGVLSGLIFLALAALAGPPWRTTAFPYFNYLADAFLHGQLFLRQTPPSTLDLSYFNGRYYLYWGPLPALLAMPWVALFGVQASDVLQTISAAAFNVALFAWLLRILDRSGFCPLTPTRRALLVVFFALGSMQTPLPAIGNVWYLGQLESIGMALLACLAAFSLRGGKAFWWTGCAVAAILATRISAVFVAVFLAWYLWRAHWNGNWSRLIRLACLGLLPLALCAAALLTYNEMRFGSPFDNGLNYHLMGAQFAASAKQYGILNPHYIPINLYIDYVFYPFYPGTGGKWIDASGGSLFLLSPLFLAALYALWRDRRDLHVWFLALSIGLGHLPALMVMAPGSVLFGPRYLLDIVAPLLILTARGMRRWPILLVIVLVALSIIQYLIGSIGMVYSMAS